jgi:peptidoglycan/LPS O-acetylase OafA/YrhL
VACLAVLFFHSFGAYTREPIWGPLEPLRAASAYGWLGLHVFFVISGYCIFERLHVGLERGEPVPSFWVDRLIRIYPTYWCVLAITILFNLLSLPFNHGLLAEAMPLSARDWLGDLTLVHTLAGWRSTVIVSWTLSYEVAFYVAAGALVLANGRESKLRFAFGLGALLCLPALRWNGAPWAGPLMYWPHFFLGACVSFALRARADLSRGRLACALAAMGAISLAALAGIGAFGDIKGLTAAGFAWTLLILRRWDRRMNLNPLMKALGWVGTFSYSLYLIHEPLLSRALNLSRRFVVPTSATFGAVWLASIAMALAGGWLVWKAFEVRCERFRTGRRRRLALAGQA